MELVTYREKASFETTKRLLAQLVNEGLLHADICIPKAAEGYLLRLTSNRSAQISTGIVAVTVQCQSNAYLHVEQNRILPILRPEYLEPPVLVELSNGNAIRETDPAEIFRYLSTWLSSKSLGAAAVEQIADELSNTVSNQGMWIIITPLSATV